MRRRDANQFSRSPSRACTRTPRGQTETSHSLPRLQPAADLDVGAAELRLVSALGPQAVEAAVALAHAAHEAAERQRRPLAGVDAISIDVANVDLNAGLVLGLDQAVGRGAEEREEKGGRRQGERRARAERRRE